MSKVLKIDQIHLRAVYARRRRRCTLLRYINTRDQSNVEGVEDRSNTSKGCNAMYVEDVH